MGLDVEKLGGELLITRAVILFVRCSYALVFFFFSSLFLVMSPCYVRFFAYGFVLLSFSSFFLWCSRSMYCFLF